MQQIKVWLSSSYESTKLPGNWFVHKSNMDALIVPLLQSCAEGNPDLLESCLRYGLDLNFATEDGLTPLMYAVTYAGMYRMRCVLITISCR